MQAAKGKMQSTILPSCDAYEPQHWSACEGTPKCAVVVLTFWWDQQLIGLKILNRRENMLGIRRLVKHPVLVSPCILRDPTTSSVDEHNS